MKRLFLASLMLALLAIGIATALISVQPIPVKPPDYTKLIITPKSKHFTAKPGDKLDFSVKIRNVDNKTVTIKPKLIPPLFPGMNVMESSWVDIKPSELTLNPNEEGKLKIEIRIPDDVERSSYSAQIVLTNETIAVPYSPYPIYPNSIRVSVYIQIPPSVTIYPRFIHDKVEPGKTYTYNVTIENGGDRSFKINPKLAVGDLYIPEGRVSYLTEDMVEVTAPKVIPPHSKVTVKIKVNFPENASGQYCGHIDLNIDDPNLEEWMQRIELSFAIRVKPSKPFVKEFEVYNVSRLNVSVTAMNYDGSVSDVDIKMYSPSGLLSIDPTKVVESIKVTPRGSFVPVPYPKSITSEEYGVSSWTMTYVYLIKNPENGKWKVEVLSACDYMTITIEKE